VDEPPKRRRKPFRIPKGSLGDTDALYDAGDLSLSQPAYASVHPIARDSRCSLARRRSRFRRADMMSAFGKVISDLGASDVRVASAMMRVRAINGGDVADRDQRAGL